MCGITLIFQSKALRQLNVMLLQTSLGASCAMAYVIVSMATQSVYSGIRPLSFICWITFHFEEFQSATIGIKEFKKKKLNLVL